MITSRRSLFGFGAALLAAPAIVRVASIMPVSVPKRIIRWLPYNVTTHSLAISREPLTLERIWRIKEVLRGQEEARALIGGASWAKDILDGKFA